MRRDHDGEGPLEAVGHILCTAADRIVNQDRNVLFLIRALVVASDIARVVAAIGDVGIGGLSHDVTAFEAGDAPPVLFADAPARRARCHGKRGVVLLGAVQTVGEGCIYRDVIELTRRQIELRERAAAVFGDLEAAVIGNDKPLRIGGVDPHVVVVAMARTDAIPRAAAIIAAEHANVQHVHAICVFGVGINVIEIPRPCTDIRVIIHAPPRCACIVAAEQAAACLVFDHGPDQVALGARHIHADLAEQTAW